MIFGKALKGNLSTLVVVGVPSPCSIVRVRSVYLLAA